MVTIDMEAKQRHERIEDFEQYAKQRKLPYVLRQRAMQSLAYKSECLLELKVGDVFTDLPTALRCQLFFEMYGSFVKNTALFEKLTKPQLEAVASVLCVEIYLHGDVIFEAGRTSSKMYIMKSGIAEIYSPTTGVVYAALEPGAVFGEFSFFIKSATRLASARAVRSCQVLQLDKKKWNLLWPRDVREEIEAQLVPLVKINYVQSANTYMNISKTLFTKNEKAAPSVSVMRVPVARLAKRLSKVHSVPRSPDNQVASTRSDRRSPKSPVPVQDVKPAQRQSFTSETTALFEPFGSQESSPRRRATMIGRRTSQLGQLVNELGGNQIFLNGKKAELAVKSPTLLSKLVDVVAPVAAEPENSSELPQQECGAKDQEISERKRDPPSNLGRRRSSVPPARRRSSATSLAEALMGQKDITDTRTLGSETLDTQVHASDNQVLEEKKDGSDDEVKDLFVRKPSNLFRSLSPPLSAPIATTVKDMGLPMASETKWRRHHKRIQGIMAFYAGSIKVLEAIQYDPEVQAARRHSISVVPTYYDHNSNEDVQHAREGLSRDYPVRRHSIQGDRKELNAKLLALDEFENKLTVEVQIPPPPIPSPIANFDKRRSISTFSSSSSLRSSPTSRANTPSRTTNDLRAAIKSEPAWWQKFFCCYTNKKRKSKNKVLPLATSARAPDRTQSNKYQIWAPVPAASPVFLENSGFRQFWNILMLVITLYYLFVIPFRMGFLHQYLSDAANVVTVEVWFMLEYLLTDFFCVIDFVLKRSYFVYLDHGQIVSDRKELAAHYWYRGSFVIDALSILPLEILAIVGVYASTTTAISALQPTMHPPQTLWHALSLLRVNRFLRGVHLHSLSDKVQRFLLYDLKLSFVRPSVCYLLRLALDFALGTHWVACLFFGISFLTYDDARPSWLTAPGMLLFEGCSSFYEVTHVPMLVAYLRSLHFSIGAITTVCYGDILPLNAIENVVTLAVIFISVAFFSMLSGGFFKFFEHELGKRAEYEEKVAQIGHFMVFHQFPARTWKQMQVYFALSWQESKGMHENHMLRGLTTTVRQDIALHVHANLMKHVRLFTHTDEQFACVVVAALQHELFVRNDVIIQRGDMGRSLYIIETGLVSICVVRNLYGRTSTAEGTADKANTHRSSVTEWISPATMPLADAQRVVAAGAHAGGRPGGIGGGTPGDGGTPVVAMGAPVLVRDLAAVLKGRGARKVTQREEKFVKGPFDYFGERSLLFGTPRNATCVALCVCSLFVLSIDRFEAILDEFPHYRSLCVKVWVMNRNLPGK